MKSMEIKIPFETFEEKSEKLKALAHPIRLCIVKGLLDNGSCQVGIMQDCLHTPQSTISQHMAKLRTLGIIEGERDGVEIHYRLADPEVEALVRTLFPDEEKKS